MPRPALPALLLAGALALTGCSADDAEQPPTSAEATGGTEQRESGAGVEAFDPDEVLVEQTLASVSDERSTVDVAVTALQVEDRVMRLELAVTPELASVSDDDEISLFDLRGFVSQPFLMDRQNLKRYTVLERETTGTYSSDGVETRTVNGRAMRVYYYFAAPEDDIDAIDVVLSDAYPAFTDVPVSR